MVDYLRLTAGEAQVKLDTEADLERMMERRCADCDSRCSVVFGDACGTVEKQKEEIAKLREENARLRKQLGI